MKKRQPEWDRVEPKMMDYCDSLIARIDGEEALELMATIMATTPKGAGNPKDKAGKAA